MKNATLLLALATCLLSATACKKADKAADPAPAGASKPVESTAPAAAAPAPTADKKLAQIGVTLALPADAQIEEAKMDMGGFQATISFAGMPNFFVANVPEGSDTLEATMKHADAKEWKLQDKSPDGSTWKLEWTKADLLDATKVKLGVAVRASVGGKLYDCGSNGLGDAEAATLLKICASMK